MLRILSQVIRNNYFSDNVELLAARNSKILELQNQRDEIEKEKKNYRRKAMGMNYSKEEIDETTTDMENDIRLIDERISEFSESTDMEKYLERLPEVLLKTFELATSTVQIRKSDEVNQDILKLIELTTVELTVNNKKELQIKLFEALDGLVNDGNSALEVLSLQGSNLAESGEWYKYAQLFYRNRRFCQKYPLWIRMAEDHERLDIHSILFDF